MTGPVQQERRDRPLWGDSPPEGGTAAPLLPPRQGLERD